MPADIENRKDAVVPKSCPFCSSPKISATGKVTAASYYRCEMCGQVWHPERMGPGRGLDYGRSR